ncbi:hypothetical protein DL96DRAFT_1613180 [Flagelloscypha sp. PMI_526]|nr:hypothetical protein DL96DRAFT_1613180 [Flagelloscypha sp. PMI_526]
MNVLQYCLVSFLCFISLCAYLRSPVGTPECCQGRPTPRPFLNPSSAASAHYVVHGSFFFSTILLSTVIKKIADARTHSKPRGTHLEIQSALKVPELALPD